MNFLMTFVVGQSFLSMMCAMKFGIFLFFAGMVCLMSAFVAIVLPETKGIPLVGSLADHEYTVRCLPQLSCDVTQYLGLRQITPLVHARGRPCYQRHGMQQMRCAAQRTQGTREEVCLWVPPGLRKSCMGR